MVSKNQSVVVTGVSTGIGWGISKILIANGFQVYGSVRRQTDADRLVDEFGGAFTPLVMDVTDRESVNRAALQVEEQLGSKTLTGLVNNAGIAINGPLLYFPLEDYRRQLEVNLIAPLSVTQAFAEVYGQPYVLPNLAWHWWLSDGELNAAMLSSQATHQQVVLDFHQQHKSAWAKPAFDPAPQVITVNGPGSDGIHGLAAKKNVVCFRHNHGRPGFDRRNDVVEGSGCSNFSAREVESRFIPHLDSPSS